MYNPFKTKSLPSCQGTVCGPHPRHDEDMSKRDNLVQLMALLCAEYAKKSSLNKLPPPISVWYNNYLENPEYYNMPDLEDAPCAYASCNGCNIAPYREHTGAILDAREIRENLIWMCSLFYVCNGLNELPERIQKWYIAYLHRERIAVDRALSHVRENQRQVLKRRMEHSAV